MIWVVDKDNTRLAPLAHGARANSYMERVSVGLYAIQSYHIVYDDAEAAQVTATLGGGHRPMFSFFEARDGEVVFLEESNISPPPAKKGQYHTHTINVSFMHATPAAGRAELHIATSDGRVDMRVSIFAESEGTESRYVVAMQNLSAKLGPRYIKAFKDSTAAEALPDRMYLNTKREEFLIEQKSLLHYIGSYHGIINAIAFFGYGDDVFIREYWEIPGGDGRAPMYATVPIGCAQAWKELPIGAVKTNMMGLAYKVNDFAGGMDADGAPALVDLFRGKDEAAEKLDNMRLVLEGEFMPAHVHFLDIAGEEIVPRNIGQRFSANEGLVYYIWEHLPFNKHSISVSPYAENRYMILTEPFTDKYSFEKADYYEIESTLAPEGLAMLETFGDTTKNNLQHDNVSTATWRLDEGYEWLLEKIDRADFIVMSNAFEGGWDEVWRATKTRGGIRASFSFASKEFGNHRLIARLTDGHGQAHTVVHDMEFYKMPANFKQAVLPAITNAETTEFKAFSEYRKHIKTPPAVKATPIADLIDTYRTGPGGHPVASYNDIGFDVNDIGSIGPGGADRYYSDSGYGLLHAITPYDMKNITPYEQRSRPLSAYGPTYVVLWIDFAGIGEVPDDKDYYITLTDLASGEAGTAGGRYNGLDARYDWPTPRDSFIYDVVDIINNATGVFSAFTASAHTAVGGDKLLIRALGKGYDTAKRYKASINGGSCKIRETPLLADRPARAKAQIVGKANSGALTTYDACARKWSTEQATIGTVGELAGRLRAKGYGDILETGSESIYVFSENAIDIRHSSFLPMIDVPRPSTYASAVPCGHGAEVLLGDIVYMMPDAALCSRPYDVGWEVRNNKTGATIKRTRSYILSFMVNEHGAYDVSFSTSDHNGHRKNITRKGVVFTIDQGNNDRRSAKRSEKG